MPAPKGHAPYKGCETGGRPKIYTEEFIDNEAEALEEWNQRDENIFIEKFCLERGYSVHRICEWVKSNQKFSAAYEMTLTKQRLFLISGGLRKKLSHPMCALLLSHSHGIVGKTEQKITGDAMNPLGFIYENVNGKTKELVNDNTWGIKHSTSESFMPKVAIE